MKRAKPLTMNQMANRISEREDNIFDVKVIKNILNMYMEECFKALISGERVQISRVGTIIPEVKTRTVCNLPVFNKEGNPPYTKLKMSRNYHMKDEMDRALMRNIKHGIYGLEKLPFSRQQMDILKDSGVIPENSGAEGREEE